MPRRKRAGQHHVQALHVNVASHRHEVLAIHVYHEAHRIGVLEEHSEGGPAKIASVMLHERIIIPSSLEGHHRPLI